MPRRPVGVAGDNAARALARMLGVRLQYDDELARAVSTALSPRTFVGRVLQRWQGRRIELVACAIATVSVLVGSTYLLLRKSPVHEPLPHPKAVAAAELLIFACSPNVAPLPQAGSEATEVAMATSWGDAVIISFGGDAERLRSSLVGSRPRHFLFTGHSDLKLGDSLTLGFTKPGGWLEAVDIELIAEMLGAHSVTNGGSLELAFINGCHSHQLGEAVRRAGVPAVVCWQGRVCDGAARLFACAFFQAVAGQMGYKRAFAEARRAVLLATSRSRLRRAIAVGGSRLFVMIYVQGLLYLAVTGMSEPDSRTMPREPAAACAVGPLSRPPTHVCKVSSFHSSARAAWLRAGWASSHQSLVWRSSHSR